MRCPKCGREFEHAYWCSDYSDSFGQRKNLLGDLFKDEDDALYGRYGDYSKDFLKPLDFECKLPDIELSKPLISEREPLDLFTKEKSSFLKNGLDPYKPALGTLPEYKPLIDKPNPLLPEPILPEPMKDTPPFPPPPAPPTGIVKNYYTGIDTGIRFTDGGVIKNYLGHNIGKVDGNLIYNDSGCREGKVADDGRIMDINGYYTGDFIDKHKL